MPETAERLLLNIEHNVGVETPITIIKISGVTARHQIRFTTA